MVEFALSAVVLLVLLGGLIDIGRSLYMTETISNAAREGARHGVWFDAPNQAHPYLDDAQIKAAVDTELATISIPASTLKNPGNTCPTTSDGNTSHNPPFINSAYPVATNQPWLYICYDNTPGVDFTTPASGQSQRDVNVILLYLYGPLTPLFGSYHVAANMHMTVQGP